MYSFTRALHCDLSVRPVSPLPTIALTATPRALFLGSRRSPISTSPVVAASYDISGGPRLAYKAKSCSSTWAAEISGGNNMQLMNDDVDK